MNIVRKRLLGFAMITVVISIVSFLFLSISNEIEYNSLIINRNDYYFNEVCNQKNSPNLFFYFNKMNE